MLAEDGVGASHVLSSVPGGPTYAIARNLLNIGTASAPEFSEFTGPTFTSDGEVLFVNIQTPGDHGPVGEVPRLTSSYAAWWLPTPRAPARWPPR